MVDITSMRGRFELPEVLLTSVAGRVTVPSWVKAFPHETRHASELRLLGRLPTMTIVQAESARAVLSHRTFLSMLVKLHAHQSMSRIVFAFRNAPLESLESKMRQYEKLLERFVRVASIQLATGPSEARPAFENALAKYLVETKAARRTLDRAPIAGDPLGEVRKVLEATGDLRSSSGRLDATRIADAFGLSVSELAGLLRRSRQAVSKTPDAESLQPQLRVFERAARLRALLTDADFRSWLNLANGGLDDRTPLEVVRAGRVDVVADFTEDLLTGVPA